MIHWQKYKVFKKLRSSIAEMPTVDCRYSTEDCGLLSIPRHWHSHYSRSAERSRREPRRHITSSWVHRTGCHPASLSGKGSTKRLPAHRAAREGKERKVLNEMRGIPAARCPRVLSLPARTKPSQRSLQTTSKDTGCGTSFCMWGWGGEGRRIGGNHQSTRTPEDLRTSRLWEAARLMR